ncbi:MAG: hypothetical protein RBR02_06270 [Desulfuromonadaceae bacterium]|nr:hypothetical protein [Desulfuromonadaceae bacterium]
MKKVYAVRQDWANYDEHDNQINLFDTKEKAKAFYEECVKLEKEQFITSNYLNENGTVDEGYILQEDEEEYEFYEDGNYDYCHSYIYIEEMEVN